MCIAYLHDVDSAAIDTAQSLTSSKPREGVQPGRLHGRRSPAYGVNLESFGHSIWFRRGWTLQELVAPTTVIFVNYDWVSLGHKQGRGTDPGLLLSPNTLNAAIADITGIRTEVFYDFSNATTLSLEEKLKWMEHRQTERREDMAYCQLGIFGVFMPLIYGERDQAMSRLRSEIRRKTAEEALQRDTPSSTIRYSVLDDKCVERRRTADTSLAENWQLICR